jgi:hypothetical protein
LEYCDQIRPIYLIHINPPDKSKHETDGGPHCNCGRRPSFDLALNLDTAALPPLAPPHMEISNAAESHRRNGVGENEADAPRPQLAFGSHWHDGCGHEGVADRSGGPPIARRRRTNHFMIVRRIASARIRKRVRIDQRIFQARLFDDRHAGLFRPGD